MQAVLRSYQEQGVDVEIWRVVRKLIDRRRHEVEELERVAFWLTYNLGELYLALG